jgi:hypothetical protein
MTRSWLLWPLISSCAAAPVPERSFAAPPEAVRSAVRASLAAHEDLLEKGDLVACGWGPERTSGEQGFFLGHEYVYRARFEVLLSGSAAAVRAAVERRAPGGPRSLRWERVDGAAAAEALLAEIGRRLEKSP